MVFLFIDGDYLLTGVNPESLHDVKLTVIDILKAIRTQLLNYPATEVNVDKDNTNNANSKEEKDEKGKTRNNVANNIDSDDDTELLLSLASGLIEARIIYFSSAVMQHIAEHTRVAFISALRHWRFQVHVLESVESRIGSPVDAAMCTRIVQMCYTFHNELLPFVHPHSATTNTNTMLDMNVVSAESAGFHHSAGNTHTNITGNGNKNNNNNPIANTEGNYLNLHKLFCIFACNTFLSSACDVALSLNFDVTLIHYNTDGVAEELLSFLSPKYANGNGKASFAKRKLENGGGGVMILHHKAAAIEALEALPITFPNMSLDVQMKIKQMKDLLLSQSQNIVSKTNYNENNLTPKPINIGNNQDYNNNVSGLITSNVIPTRAITDATLTSSNVNPKKETNNINNNKNSYNNNDMKDNITEQNKSVNNNISASQVQKRALFPFTSPPPPLPGLPDPFAIDNYPIANSSDNNNRSNKISNRINATTQDTSDSDDDEEEAKVVEVIQSEHTPSFSMNVFDNDRSKASNVQSQINCLQENQQQEHQQEKQESGSLNTSKALDVACNNDKHQSKSFAEMQKELNDLLSGLHKPQQPSMSFSEPSLLSLSTSENKNNCSIDMNATSTEKETNTLPSMLSITNKTDNNIAGANKLLSQHEQSHSQARTTSTSSTQGSAISKTNDISSKSNTQQQTSTPTLRPPKLFTELPPG